MDTLKTDPEYGPMAENLAGLLSRLAEAEATAAVAGAVARDPSTPRPLRGASMVVGPTAAASATIADPNAAVREARAVVADLDAAVALQRREMAGAKRRASGRICRAALPEFVPLVAELVDAGRRFTLAVGALDRFYTAVAATGAELTHPLSVIPIDRAAFGTGVGTSPLSATVERAAGILAEARKQMPADGGLSDREAEPPPAARRQPPRHRP